MTRIGSIAAAVVLAVISYFLFSRLCARAGKHRRALFYLVVILPAPAYLMLSNYFTGSPGGDWYTNLRAFPGIESLLGLIGAPLGAVTASEWLKKYKYAEPARMVFLAMAIMLLCGPFLPDIYGSVNYSNLRNQWEEGVCLQSSNFTCVPACMATILRMNGEKATERELAEAIGTTAVGADDWYIKRGLRQFGYEVHFGRGKSAKDAPVPCVLSVLVANDIPHVVVLLEKDSKGVTIGEPLAGKREFDWHTFEVNYRPNGSYMTLEPIKR